MNGTLKYEVPTATQNIDDRYIEDYEIMETQELSSYADGGYQSLDFIDEKTSVKYDELGDVSNLIALQNDNFYGLDGERHSNFLPFLLAPLSQTKRGQKMLKGTFLDKKVMAERRKARQERRQSRQDRKKTEADAKLETARSLGKGSEADLEIAKSLASQPQAEQKKGLSKGAIIGISIGALVLVGVIVFFVIKKKNAGALSKPAI